MKTILLAAAFFILASVFFSWDYPKNSTNKLNVYQSSHYNSGAQSNLEGPELFIGDEANTASGINEVFGAEDVLIKRIPGDNNHLLMMAFFSKENYSGPSFTINNGYIIVFNDDGKGYDEKAGDGLYTARITADTKEFRKQAINLLERVKKTGYKPVRYINRQMVYNPEASESFDTESFDQNKAVSISYLTNSLAAAGTPALDKVGTNSMFITDLAVVEDSNRTWNFCTQKGNVNGAWTFGKLMRQLASKSPSAIATDAQVSDFVKNWLGSWQNTQIINGDTVAARTLINDKIINPWLTKSKNAGAPAGQLDMRFEPFKLTAIVNRFDLRDGNKFGIPRNYCGEGRFVFCLIKNDCTVPLNMTVIFEFGINKQNICEDKLSWAQQWFNLSNLTLGSRQYNKALQAITDQFTLCGSDSSRHNQSSLNHLRTNEIVLSPVPKLWEMREFVISSSGNLRQTTVGQTPADKYNAKVVNADVQRMAAYINQNQAEIIGGKNIVPAIWQGFPFLGGKTIVNGPPTGDAPNAYHWNGTKASNSSTFITNNDARSNFSLSACSGCHAGETQTAFTHVDPVPFGTKATLSGFASGKAGAGGAIDFDSIPTNGVMAVKDAALRPSPSAPRIRKFNEIGRRGSDLISFVNTTCGSVLGIGAQLMFQPLNMVH